MQEVQLRRDALCATFVSFLRPPLQHKKLAEGSAYEEVSTSTPYSENDISNSIKNGILYLEDPINHVRRPGLEHENVHTVTDHRALSCHEELVGHFSDIFPLTVCPLSVPPPI